MLFKGGNFDLELVDEPTYTPRSADKGAVRLITSILMLPELTSSGHQCESELFRVSGVAPDSPERPSR